MKIIDSATIVPTPYPSAHSQSDSGACGTPTQTSAIAGTAIEPIRQPIASDGIEPQTRAQVAEQVPAPHQKMAQKRPPSRPVNAAPRTRSLGSGCAPPPGL